MELPDEMELDDEEGEGEGDADTEPPPGGAEDADKASQQQQGEPDSEPAPDAEDELAEGPEEDKQAGDEQAADEGQADQAQAGLDPELDEDEAMAEPQESQPAQQQGVLVCQCLHGRRMLGHARLQMMQLWQSSPAAKVVVSISDNVTGWWWTCTPSACREAFSHAHQGVCEPKGIAAEHDNRCSS